MEIGEKGLQLIKDSEGLRLTAYQDAVGIWTIGYGHVLQFGEDFGPIAEQQAEALLRTDIKWAEDAVNLLVRVPLTQNQFDALVDFTFNLGIKTLKKSTLLKLLNSGDYAAVPKQFLEYVYAGGKRLGGLIKRRGAEATLFMEKR